MPDSDFERVLALPNLQWAWRRVRENRGAAGSDGISLKRFERNLDFELISLADDVRSGTYQPGRYRRTTFWQRGKQRQIVILPVRDRVLQRAVADIVGPRAEQHFLPCSYGYRPGRSLHDAVEDIVQARDSGLEWVVEADIQDCFGSLDHRLLREAVDGVVRDLGLRTLIGQWITGPPRSRPLKRTVGVPQGGVISPLLCNLYLHHFDQRIRRRRYHVVRYADDFVVLCRSQRHAEWALRAVERVLAGLKLNVNHDKTRISSFADGFVFLGVHFQDNTYRYQVEDLRFVITHNDLPDWFHEHPESLY